MQGEHGMEKDVSRAIELWSEAAELGSVDAISNMGDAYFSGKWGVSQNRARGIHYWELAAMKGDAESRHNLGAIEESSGNHHRALRHYLISAKLGEKSSLDAIKAMFHDGLATKAQYVEALKGYQNAAQEMKSPQRDEAARRGAELGF